MNSDAFIAANKNDFGFVNPTSANNNDGKLTFKGEIPYGTRLVIYDKDKKEIEVIKGRPTEKTKQEIKVATSSSSQVTMRWDDKISGYKVCYSLSIDFKQ